MPTTAVHVSTLGLMHTKNRNGINAMEYSGENTRRNSGTLSRLWGCGCGADTTFPEGEQCREDKEQQERRERPDLGVFRNSGARSERKEDPRELHRQPVSDDGKVTRLSLPAQDNC